MCNEQMNYLLILWGRRVEEQGKAARENVEIHGCVNKCFFSMDLK